MNQRFVLRILILSEVVFGGLGVCIDSLTAGSLPEGLREYHEDVSPHFEEHFVAAATFACLVIAGMIISWVGLWVFWNPARFIYLFTLALSFATTPLLGPSLWTAWGGVLTDLAGLSAGGILVLIFCTTLRDNFRPKNTEQGAPDQPATTVESK